MSGGGQGIPGGGDGYQVPSGLQEMLIEFTVSVLVEQPPDLVIYAAEYFRRQQQEQATLPIPRLVEGEDSIDDDDTLPG